MTTKSRAPIVVTAVLLVTVAAVTGYLLYAIPSSDADRLSRQVTRLQLEHSRLDGQVVAAERRVAAAKRSARTAWSRAGKEYSKGRERGRAEGVASASESYDKGFAAGSAAAFGRYGGDWANGAFYVVRVDGGQIAARTVLQPCLAVYADQGSVWVQGPAC